LPKRIRAEKKCILFSLQQNQAILSFAIHHLHTLPMPFRNDWAGAHRAKPTRAATGRVGVR